MLTLAHRAMLGAGSRPKNDVGIIGLRPSGVPAYSAKGAIDSSGNRYVVGYSNLTLAVAKVAPDGSIVWQRNLAAGYSSMPNSVAVDSAGAVYVCGNAANSSGAANLFAFLVKYNSSGAIQWQRKISGASVGASAEDVVVSSTGDVYIFGRIQDTPNVAYIAKYSTGGSLQWQKKLSHGSHNLNVQSGRMSITPTDVLCFTGSHVVSTYDTCAVAFTVSDAGALLAQKAIARVAFSSSAGRSFVVDSSGNWFISCILPKSGSDFFPCILKLNSSGVAQWCFSIESAAYSAPQLLLDGSDLYTASGNVWMKLLTSDGSIQMQRQLKPSNSAGIAGPIAVDGGRLHAGGNINTDSTSYAASGLYSFPLDGEGLGTYGTAIVYSEPTFTRTTFTPTISTPSYAISTSSYAEAAAGMTDSAGALIATPEVKTA